MKEGLLYRVSLKVVPVVFDYLTRIWFGTCRITVHGAEYREQTIEKGVASIGAFWHYGIVFILHYFRDLEVAAMVSASRDGEYISRIVEQIDSHAVRGSRKKGGMQAIKKMIRLVRQGVHAVIVADGSQGPPRIVQAGSLVLSSRTGSPVLPLAWSCSRYKSFGSWDRTALPMPFSTIHFFYGEPLTVPGGIKGDEIESYRLQLEKRLNDLYEEAWAVFGKEEH
ncbi:MAG: lysophospholipid acyltransferase family protein [Thermodesulfobacteriota bacterium]